MPALSSLELIQAHRWSRLFFTTYALSLSFFEAVILERIVRQQIGSCSILADVFGVRTAMDEVGAHGAGRTYDIEPVAVRNGCFHPKLLALLRALADIEDICNDKNCKDCRFANDEREHGDTSAGGQRPRSLVLCLSKSQRAHCSYLQSGSSGCLRSHNGRRLPTTGSVAKLYSGGGELVDHSSVQASHGSLPAGRPRKYAHTRLYAKIKTAIPWITPPIEMIMFSVFRGQARRYRSSAAYPIFQGSALCRN